MTVICDRCGEAWERHPAELVPCPDCGAAPNTPCVRPSGHAHWRYMLPHVAREQLAVDTGAMSRCRAALPPPGGPLQATLF